MNLHVIKEYKFIVKMVYIEIELNGDTEPLDAR